MLATNISSARVFITPVRVDRPRQKRPLRRHASASGITFVAHVEVRAVAIRQSRRAPRFAAAHALASAIRDVLARGRMPATCSFAACVLRHARARDVRAMCIPASHACIGRARRHHDTRRLARQAPRIAHVERAGRLPRLAPTLFGSNQIESNRACRARRRIAPFIDSAPLPARKRHRAAHRPARRSQPASKLRRYAAGLVAAMRLKCRRSDSSEPNPASAATRATGNAGSRSIISFASPTRSRISHSYGPSPVASRNCRCSVRGLIAARAALRLARLGRPVKLMLGGVTGWLDEGFALARGNGAPRRQGGVRQRTAGNDPLRNRNN
ncbi:hypothetical protein DO72_3823 [Burkholderia pseudomallei]|nr:hypothetical protein DO72_3823 [Burkholderia pseudomallei]